MNKYNITCVMCGIENKHRVNYCRGYTIKYNIDKESRPMDCRVNDLPTPWDKEHLHITCSVCNYESKVDIVKGGDKDE